MKNLHRSTLAGAVLVVLASSFRLRAQDAADGFVPLFNGTDLKGFVNVNGAPSTWSARDGIIVCSGVPTGVMRTERMYENFVLELEWRHLKKGGNAGLFVWSDPLCTRGQPFTRSIEVQVMDGTETKDYTSHGDIFSIWGAKMKPDRPHPGGWERCLPSEQRCKPSPEWNHYRVTCNLGTIKLEVNGKEVSGASEITPRKGYLCLESEGSEAHFRNLRIKELPAAVPPLSATEVAQAASDFRPLYNGVDLQGWKVLPAHQGHWRPSDWKLDYDGKGETLWTLEEFGDFELIADWRWTGPAKEEAVPVVLANGETPVGEDGKPKTVMAKVAGDSGIYFRGGEKSQVNIWCWPVGSGEVYGYRTDLTQPAEVRAGVTPKVAADHKIGEWNRFIITVKGEELSVILNGKTVIEHARLPGLPKKGPIGLQHHGSPLQFANLHVRSL